MCGFPHSIVTKLSLVSCLVFPSGWGHPTGSRSLICSRLKELLQLGSSSSPALPRSGFVPSFGNPFGSVAI